MSSNLPAPKTFAPSREDVLSTLGFFFGDPAVPEKLKDYSEHHAMTYHFPDGKHRLATQHCVHSAYTFQNSQLCTFLFVRSILRPEHVRLANLEPFPEPTHIYTRSEWQ